MPSQLALPVRAALVGLLLLLTGCEDFCLFPGPGGCYPTSALLIVDEHAPGQCSSEAASEEQECTAPEDCPPICCACESLGEEAGEGYFLRRACLPRDPDDPGEGYHCKVDPSYCGAPYDTAFGDGNVCSRADARMSDAGDAG